MSSESANAAVMARSDQQLRPRRNGPGPEAVARHQRARLYAAMIDAVAEHGYAATTVTDLRRRAGVSKRTIYDQFSSKEAFFLATYDLVILRLVGSILDSYRSERDWSESLAHGFQAFARELANDPRAARLAFIEAPGAGLAALTRTESTNRKFEQLLDAGLSRAPDEVTPSRRVVRAIVGGITSVLRLRLLEGGISDHSLLALELTDWALSYRAFVPDQCSEISLDRGDRSGGAPLHRKGPEMERLRILHSAIYIASLHGYANLNVARILQESQSSDEVFFSLFQSSQQCFMQALQVDIQDGLRCLANGTSDPENWEADIRRGLCALLAYLADNPDFARSVCIEIFAAGPSGVEYNAAVTKELGLLVMKRVPESRRPNELVGQAIAGAVWEVIHHYVKSGAIARLNEAADYVTCLVLSPLAGSRRPLQMPTDHRLPAGTY